MWFYIGYLTDPDHIPGLAHFCEHMLFLGTEKYPKENDYSKFLSEHGGCSNAATYPDHTTYYFDIVPDHLKNALDRYDTYYLIVKCVYFNLEIIIDLPNSSYIRYLLNPLRNEKWMLLILNMTRTVQVICGDWINLTNTRLILNIRIISLEQVDSSNVQYFLDCKWHNDF